MGKLLVRLNFRYLILALVIFLAAGCATTTIPVDKFDSLAQSSKKLLKITIDTYTRFLKLQRRFCVETADDSTLTPDTFRPVLKGKTYDFTQVLHFRESALDALVKYILLLQALAKRDLAGEVDKSTTKLAVSLKSLRVAVIPDNLSRETAKTASGILMTLVDIIGRGIVRRMRLEALKKAMEKAQPGIKKLAQLTVVGNKKLKKAVTKMLDRIVAHRNVMRPPIFTEKRFAFDTEVSLLITEADAIQAILEHQSKAINKVYDAHREIRRKLDHKPTKFEALWKFIQEVERIAKFYRSLK